MVDNEALLQLKNRIGPQHLGKRLELQVTHSAFRFGPTGFHIYWENLDALGPMLKSVLKLSGLLNRATGNSIDYKVEVVTVPLRGLPPAFHGFRILHLSDLHIEGIFDQGKKLKEVLRTLTYDLCVITGDFRFLTFGDYQEAIALMTDLTNAIHCPYGILGILGNHDFIEMVPPLEKIGIPILLNEAVPLHKDGETLWMIGVDDPHWYEVADLPRALDGVPQEAVKILLAHSTEIIPEAFVAGIDYYLCGHTHGGQICLPGQIPILNSSNFSRQYISGGWTYQERMLGYTSRGTGTSLLPVRFNCPPEITLHQLV